jgi:hypothetical protein
VKYNKDIALKYIKNLLFQYNKDGLSSQRFSRTTQAGLGSDILAGSSTTITALYRDIYGIRPKWNRFGLEPNMLRELNGTEFNYTLRDKVYKIHLKENSYKVSTPDFSLEDSDAFGVSMIGSMLLYYPGNRDTEELSVTSADALPPDAIISEWSDKIRRWKMSSTGIYFFSVKKLVPDTSYKLSVNGKETELFKADATGVISFEYNCQVPVLFSISK